MTEQESELVERMAQLLAEAGMPRVAGRIWAYLLICEPPQQSAAELAEALHASRGAISGAVRILATAGLIRRTRRPGERREVFLVPPGSIIGTLNARLPVTTMWRQTADDGLELLRDRTPEQRARLQEVRDVYAFMETELPSMLERFVARRKEPTP